MAGAEDGDVIDASRQVRKQIGYFDTALTVLAELPCRAQQPGVLLDELVLRLTKLGRSRLAVQPVQQWFGVEGFQVTGPTSHEQEDDRPCLRRLMRLFSCERVGTRPLLLQQRGQCQRAEAAVGVT